MAKGLIYNKGLGRGALIDDQPIITKVFDHGLKLAEINRFLDIAVDAQSVAFDEIALLARRSHYHDGDRSGAGIAFELLEHFQTVNLGQF